MRRSQQYSSREPSPHITSLPRIKKSRLAPRGMDLDQETLFDTVSIETGGAQFNIVNPGNGTCETVLKMKNPCLLAIQTRAKVNKSAVPPKTSHGIGRQPIGQGITSLLSKKPLSDLPDPPMTTIEAVKEREELERISLMFNEDPIAYFSKRKDGRGHLFIYLVYAKTSKDPEFSPYELVKVPHCDIGKDYFTMSANGVTHVEESGETEHITLDRWAKEESIYKSIRKLRTFHYFLLWKPLRVWRNYIMKQRYNETLDDVVQYPLYYNVSFASGSVAVASLLEKSDEIITAHCLSLYQNRKYRLKEFLDLSASNLRLLSDKYTKFIEKATDLTKELYGMLSDPEILVVTDQEFPEIRRKNPNIGQLIILERKKDAERIRRKDQMHDELISLANFLRMLDYMLLESMRASCYTAFRIAELNCQQDLSAVFQVEVFFADDGKVSFDPNEETLIKNVRNVLHDSAQTLEKMPRLLRATELRHILRDSNINIPALFDDGPDFVNMTECSTLLNEIEEHIVTIIKNSYTEAEQYSLAFKDFYPLFKLGQTWNVMNYIKTPSGEPYTRSLVIGDRSNEEDDAFLMHPENEPYINFDQMRADITQLHMEENRVGNIKSGNTKGIIHVDSRNLKATLNPIPTKSLIDIENMLKELMQFKNDMLHRVFKTYSMKLKTEPTSLEMFASFCELLQRTTDLIPQITKEISFVDDLVNLFDEAGFEAAKNQLHRPFHAFKVEQQTAMQVRESNHERFEFLLQQLIKSKERKLEKYRDRSIGQIPLSTKDYNVEKFLELTTQLKRKTEILYPTIEKCIQYQKILNVQQSEFANYDELVQNIEFAEKLYQAIKLWDSISSQSNDVPFSHIPMKQFAQDAETLVKELDGLKTMWKKPSPIISEISVEFNELIPFIPQLTQLSFGRMQPRHWKQLFEECEQQDVYNPEITIQQLLALGILENADKIREITITSQGESQLENEFQAIITHWAEIELPIQDTPPPTDDYMLLGPLETLRADIDDTTQTLNNMLQNRFVKGIHDNVYDLGQTMVNIVGILDAWEIFECNWKILSSLFVQRAVREALPTQTTRFQIAKRKWMGIVEHTLTDTKLFKVCSFPTLADDLQSNNESLEIILQALSSYLDKKREKIPRLYFLSNDEIITLCSTSNFHEFSAEACKMLMNISQLDAQVAEQKEGQAKSATDEDSARDGNGFIDLRINGLVGEDGDTLPFINPIICEGPMENWMPQVFESMSEATKEAIAVSLSRISSSSLEDWIMTVSSYIAVLTLQITFGRDIEDCFNNLETNPRSFQLYESVLKHKIQDLMGIMTTPLPNCELNKISSILILLMGQFDKTRACQSKSPNWSAQLAWKDSLRFKYDTSTLDINILCGDNVWQHGHEFWGLAPTLIMTPTIEQSINNLCNAQTNQQLPLIFGPFGVGKGEVIRSYAAYLGRFIYIAAAFPSFSNYFVSRLFIGAALSDTWLNFSETDQLNQSSMSYLFDSLRVFMDAKLSNNTKFIHNGTFYDIKPNTQFFFTSGLHSIVETTIPPQLKAYVRPIALSQPLIKKVFDTKLIAYGFKSAKSLSIKIDEFVNAVIPLFNLTPSHLHHGLMITKGAADILRQLMHNTKVSFLDYYEDALLAEDYAVARSEFTYLKAIIKESQYDLLVSVIFSYLPVFEDYEKFKDTIVNPFNFFVDKACELIENVIRSKIDSFNLELPVDYLIEKTKLLFQIMQRTPCVIIVGPPNSGKSLIIELLGIAYLAMVSDADTVNHFTGIMPLKIMSIYQNSDTWANIFGQIEDGNISHEKVWSYGLFQTILTNLNFVSKTQHRILRFDGKMTPKFCKFLYQFVSEESALRMNCLGSIPVEHSFHCFVETDDISTLSPDILSVSGILTLTNLQVQHGFLSVNKACNLIFPEYPFSEAALQFRDKLSDEDYKVLKEIFIDMAPIVLTKISQIPNYIDLPSLADNFIMKAASFGIQFILTNKVDISKEELVRLCLIQGFYYVFSSIIEASKVKEFEAWLIQQFNITLPADWGDVQPPEQYSDMYPTPSLGSVTIENNKIVSLDHTVLSSRAIVKLQDGGSMPLFIEDIVIPNVALMMPTIAIQTAMKNHQHILLYGPPFSGKSTVLTQLFHQNQDIFPIEFRLSPLITKDNVLTIIKHSTNLLQKITIDSDKPKTYCLIFSNIDNAHYSVIDFIRQLITSKTITNTSKIDPKIKDEIVIKNFFIVLKATKISHLPNRFIKSFIPIQMTQYQGKIMEYICIKAMKSFGISGELINIMQKLVSTLTMQLSDMLEIILAICHIPERAAASDDDRLTTLRLLLSEIYFTNYRGEWDSFAGMISTVKQTCEDNNFGTSLKQILDDKVIATTEYKFGEKPGEFTATIIELNTDATVEKLINKLKTKVSDTTFKGFMALNHMLGKPDHHCAIVSKSGTGRLSLINLYCQVYNYVVVKLSKEVDHKTAIKEAIIDSILNNQIHVFTLNVTEDTKDQYEFLYSVIKLRHLVLVFTLDEIDKLIKDKSQIEEVTENIRHEWVSKISFMMKCRCRIAVSLDITISYPGVEIYEYNPPETVEILSNLLPVKYANLSDPLLKVYESIQQYLPINCINYFYDYVSTFSKYIESNAFDDSLDSEVALDFLDRLSKENGVFKESLDTMSPDLEKLREENNKLKTEFDSINEAITKRKQDLREELKMKTEDLTTKRQEVQISQEDLAQYEPLFQDAQKEVKELTDNDVTPIRITHKEPDPSIRMMLEAYLLLMGLSTDFETSGKPLLENSNFLQTILGIRENQITEEVLETVKPYLNEPNLQKKRLENVAPILITLRKYLEALTIYANHCLKIKNLQTEADVRMKDLSEFAEAMKKELDEIKEEEEKNKEQENNVNEVNEKFTKMEAEYTLIKSQNETIEAILKDTEKVIPKWTEESKRRKELGALNIGDCIVFSIYLAYCGMLDKDTRKTVLKTALDCVKEMKIPYSFTDPLDSVIHKISIINKFSIPNANVVQSILVDLQHMTMAPKLPLLIDPDGILVETFLSSNKAFIASIYASDFEVSLIESIKEGRLLLIADTDCMHYRFLLVNDIMKSASDTFTIKGTVVKRNENFRVIFVTNITDVEQIPVELVRKLTVVNVGSSTMESIKQIIMRTFINHFNGKLIAKTSDIEKAETARNITARNAEHQILECIVTMATNRQNDPEYSYFNDKEVFESLMKAKVEFNEALKLTSDAIAYRNEIDEEMSELQPIIEMCRTFWVCLSRYMPKISVQYRFSFQAFQKVISSLFHGYTIITHKVTDEQYEKIKKDITFALLSHIFPMLSLRDIIFFLFIVAFMMKDQNWEDLAMIIANLHDSFDKELNYGSCPSYVTPIPSLKINKLNDFFDLVMKWITDYFGEEILNNLPNFQVDSIISQSASIPIVINSDKDQDMMPHILQFINNRARTDTTDVISLSDDPQVIANAKATIQGAMSRGNWVIITYNEPSKEQAGVINDILFLLCANTLNSNFRVILNLHTDKYITSPLFTKAKRIFMLSYPSIRQTLRMLFHHYSSTIRSNKNVKTIKKMFYYGTIVYAQMQLRAFIQPLGFNLYSGLQMTNFKDYFEFIRPIFEDWEGEIPYKNIRDHIQEIAYGCKMIETQDRRRLRAILASVFVPTATEDNFCFLDQESNEMNYWLCPQDGPMNVFQAHFQQMPVFSTTDILLINKITGMPLLNWNISRWLSKPFLSIYNESAAIPDDINSKTHETLAALPSEINEVDQTLLLTPLLQFWINEVDRYNAIIHLCQEDLLEQNDELSLDLIHNRLPKKWAIASHDLCIHSIQRFFLKLAEQRKFLIDRLKGEPMPSIDISLVTDIKGFFGVYLEELVFQSRECLDGFTLDFSVLRQGDTKSSLGLVITGLYIFNGQMVNGALELPTLVTRNPFDKFPPILCRMSKKGTRTQQAYVCPIYKYAFFKDMIHDSDTEMYDGETMNYIMDIFLPTSKGDRTLLLNSTSLYCHIPDNFV